MHRATLDKDPADVARMFDRVAPRYDLTNDVLSLGQTYLWRRAVLRCADAEPGERVLDIAAGTGTSSIGFAERGIEVVPADFSRGMLAQGRLRYPGMSFTAADALHLPFADGSFDVVTMSFGLRNVSDVPAALAEFARVAKPGGRLVICEFSQPVWRPLRIAYLHYLMRALPAVARKISSNPDSYVYLAESIRAWPSQSGLAEIIARAGWTSVTWRNLTGGIVALHHAVSP